MGPHPHDAASLYQSKKTVVGFTPRKIIHKSLEGKVIGGQGREAGKVRPWGVCAREGRRG